jgi:hypothetical protein
MPDNSGVESQLGLRWSEAMPAGCGKLRLERQSADNKLEWANSGTYFARFLGKKLGEGIRRFVMTTPIPETALLHCVALLPERVNVLQRAQKSLEANYPGITNDMDWTTLSTPRKSTFGPLRHGPWQWHVLIDSGGLPADIAAIVSQCHMSHEARHEVENLRISVMIFLQVAPANANHVERMKHLCQVAWACLDGGATVVAWPSGRVAWHRDKLLSLSPSELSANDIDLFVSYGIACSLDEQQLALRTWGMGQFGLPDLVCISSKEEEDLEAADVLMMSMKTYLLDRGGPLPVGDTIELEDCLWQVVPSLKIPDRSCIASQFGVQYFARSE